jgi:regulator of RNase E activity RraA
MSNPGFRIYTEINRPSQKLIHSFAKFPSSNINDEMGRMACTDAEIRPYNNIRLLGSAFTVKVPAGEFLMVHKAIDLAQPGDVIVVDGQGDVTKALIGEVMTRYAMSRGIAGFVIDGAIRDSGAIKNLAFPVYARGVTSNGPYKVGPGEINVPIVCGGIVVKPGYIVVGDEDGVVFINPEDAKVILSKTQAHYDREVQMFEDIKAGTLDRSWIDKILAENGCGIIK